MKIFDSHAHLLFPKLKSNLNQILLNALKSDVNHIMNIALGPDVTNLHKALTLKNKLDGIAVTAGIHPHDAKNYSEEYSNEVVKYRDQISAVGEIGLDYHYDFSPKQAQIEVFEKQIEMANSLDKPIVMHIREAHEDAISVLKNFKLKKPAILHCFTSDTKTAEQYLNMGFYISFSGVITFPNAKETQKAAQIVPNGKYLIETDSPYLAPVPKRGKTCESAFTLFTLKKLAELKNMPVEEVALHSFQTTFEAFNLPENFAPLNSEQIRNFNPELL